MVVIVDIRCLCIIYLIFIQVRNQHAYFWFTESESVLVKKAMFVYNLVILFWIKKMINYAKFYFMFTCIWYILSWLFENPKEQTSLWNSRMYIDIGLHHITLMMRQRWPRKRQWLQLSTLKRYKYSYFQLCESLRESI